MFDMDEFTAASAVQVVQPCSEMLQALDLVRARVTVSQMRLSRLIGDGSHCVLIGQGDDAVLSLQFEPSDSELSFDRSDPMLLSGKFGELEIAHGARLLRGVTGVDIGTERDICTERWAWLKAAVIGRLTGTPLDCVDELSFVRLPDTDKLTVLRVTLQTRNHAFSTSARGSASAWLVFLSAAPWVRKRRPAAEFADLLPQITVQVARHTMPLHVADTLCPGDIILPDSPNFIPNGEGVIRLGGLTARVSYSAPCVLNIIALEGNMEQNELDVLDIDTPVDSDSDLTTIASETISEAQQVPTAIALDQVEVTLDFELGKTHMSFGELRTLGVGTVLQVEGGSPASLAIVSGGRRLGCGEAVDVNGQLGIRVTHWGPGQ